MKKKKILQNLILALFSFTAMNGVAQEKYVSHEVLPGETIYSISKKYKVTPYSILQRNPDIKDVEEIKPQTILIIPVANRSNSISAKKNGQTLPQIEPLGFKKHKVRKRETFESILFKYGISEQQLKRYNAELYAEPLKKGMVLQIPEYPKTDATEERELEFDNYIVKPKETRWSIAHKFGISLDSLAALNPDLPINSSYLADGQSLKVPRPKGDSLDEQEVILYESYTVPKSIGLYRVSQNYDISVDSIMRLNPQIAEAGGLKEGMVLRLPKPTSKNELINTDNYIFHVVKPKQNIFRLTQELKISRDSLYLLNPELENGLKAGMILKLPKTKAKQLEVKNSLVMEQINLVDSIDVANRPNLVFMLPFRLDRINFSDNEKTEAQVKTRKDIRYSMGLYTGALIALDSIKKLGLSVNARFIDTENDSLKVNAALVPESLIGVDAIVGPVFPSLLGEIAAKSSSAEVPLVVPFASESSYQFNNIFFSSPKDAVLRDKLLDYVESQRTTEEIIVIADAKHQVARDSILSKFPRARSAKMSADGSLHLVDFEDMLLDDTTYWIFVETNDQNLVSSISSILNAKNSEELYTVRMFTTNYNSAFESESVSRPHLSNLEFTFPSAFREVEDDSFTKAYRKKFGYRPDRYAVRGFDITYDLLLKLAHKKNLFATSQIIGQTEYSGNRFDYVNRWMSGYYNTASYLMKYQDLRLMEIKENEIKGNASR
ncbi:LysM peptidoglycan-binding domain-containing protein [Croceivirga thetidis]|nr:LysM peptidoglycan-binding domain-containing protein [Croceivirga thetidis]